MTGIVPLKKGENITSFFAVAKVRRITCEKKAGHTGTLDPNATGVLPIALGGATRFIELLPTHKKEYKARFKIGFRTDTLDIWGEVTEKCEKTLNLEEILAVLPEFTGEIEQIPPMYSALKKDGVRLYQLAREGKEIEREKRKCEIYNLEVSEVEDGEFSLCCECSAGTYIRSLIDDIGVRAGSFATMTALERTYACGVGIDDCYTIEQLDALKDEGRIEEAVIPIDRLLTDYPSITVTDSQGKRFKNGGELDAKRVRELKANGVYRIYANNEFLGLGEYEEGTGSLKVKRVYVEK